MYAKATRNAIELTDDQRQVVARVYPAIDAARYQGFLLKGVTGSGKATRNVWWVQ